jgi:hypothetical protein
MLNEESKSSEEVFLTSSTRLATALLSLGETLRRPPCTRQLRRDGNTIVTFMFEKGGCGSHAVKWLELEQQDPGSDTPVNLQNRVTWLREIVEDNNPVAVAYANSAWRDLALMIVKATPRMVEIYGKDAMGFIREDATPADLKQIGKYI